MLRRLYGLLFVTLIIFGAAVAEHPLLVSLQLGESRFRDWSYGHRMDRRQINCVQFVAEVTRELLQRDLTPEEVSAIYIKLPRRERNLDRLIARRDPRMAGIQKALLETGRGIVVKPEEAAPGDFIQYWTRRDGRWRGHSAVIAEIEKRDSRICSVVFGSHQSLGGIGISNFEVGLNDPDVLVYIVRFKR